MTPKNEHREAEGLERLIPAFTEMRDELRQAREQITSLNSVHTVGLRPRAIVNGTSQRLATSANTLRGWALRETTGTTPAVVRFRDGFDATGDLLVPISLAANESTRDWPTHGLQFVTGLYVEIVSGSVEGIVYLGPVAT